MFCVSAIQALALAAWRKLDRHAGVPSWLAERDPRSVVGECGEKVLLNSQTRLPVQDIHGVSNR